MMNKAELILHPVRMRILTTIGARQLTAKQLIEELPDVAQATLYRHLNTLAEGGVLTVVSHHPVRGTMEKVYALAEQASNLSPEDLATYSKDDHMQLFTVFITSVLNDFAAYLEAHEHVDLCADGVSYRKAALYLSDDELAELTTAMLKVLQPYFRNGPDADRRRRILATIMLPDATISTEE